MVVFRFVFHFPLGASELHYYFRKYVNGIDSERECPLKANGETVTTGNICRSNRL